MATTCSTSTIQLMHVEGHPEPDCAEMFRKLEEKENKDYNLRQYFSAKEWASLCDLEKRRFKNIIINYELMLECGLQVGKPEFMRKDWKKEKENAWQLDSDSDEEWTPEKAREKEREEELRHVNRGKRKKKIEFPQVKMVTVDVTKAMKEGHERAINAKKMKQNFQTVSKKGQLPDMVELFAEDDLTEFCGFTEEEISESEKRFRRIQKKNDGTVRRTNRNGTRSCNQAATNVTFRTTRYPKRNIPKTDYSMVEVPDDDCFLYCEDCNMEHLGDCPIHGPLIVIEDSKTAPDDSLRADHSCPDGLLIKESKIPAAGSGVWSNKAFPKGIRFGPYSGDVRHDVDEVHASGYGWQIFKNDKASHYVDAKDVSTSNWMRYVNCARHDAEQNLLAFQYLGGIYYKTLVPIQQNEELLVWYGDEYAKELGISKPAWRQHNVSEKRVDDQQLQHSVGLECRNPDVQDFQCNLCSKLYTKEEYLLIHKWKIHREPLGTEFMCKVCCRRFPTEARLQDHCDRIHTKDSSKETEEAKNQGSYKNSECNTPYSCPVCREGYVSKSKLVVHMRVHNEETPHVCNVCGKGFTQSCDLTKHMRIHSGDRPYKCNVCGKGFNRSHNLTTHMRIHSGDRPYKCNVCGKGFNRSHNLTTHMRIHSGDRPYKCNACGKGFNQSSALTTHMRIHSGDRPYKCNVCGKGFTQSYDLTKHTRIHSGDRPFKCNVCGKGFNQSSALTTHTRIHSGERPYTCKLCGKGLISSGKLSTHMKTNRHETLESNEV